MEGLLFERHYPLPGAPPYRPDLVESDPVSRAALERLRLQLAMSRGVPPSMSDLSALVGQGSMPQLLNSQRGAHPNASPFALPTAHLWQQWLALHSISQGSLPGIPTPTISSPPTTSNDIRSPRPVFPGMAHPLSLHRFHPYTLNKGEGLNSPPPRPSTDDR